MKGVVQIPVLASFYKNIFSTIVFTSYFVCAFGSETVYSVKQGIPQSTINKIIQSRDGTIWLATRSGGIASYDGKSFKHFSHPNSLSTLDVINLFEDKLGNIWYVGKNGLGRIFKGEFVEDSVYQAIMKELNAPYLQFFEHEDGVEVLSNTKKSFLFEFDSGNFFEIPGKRGKAPYLFRDYHYDGFTLYTGSKGIALYNGENYSEVLVGTRFSHEIIEEAVYHDNAYFFISHDSLFSFQNNVLKNIGNRYTTSKLTKLDVYNNKVVVGTTGDGLMMVENNQLVPYGVRRLGAPYHITALFVDRDHNLWVGVDGLGVIKYREDYFDSFDPEEILSKRMTLGVCGSPNGDIWVGRQNGVAQYNGSKIIYYGQEEGLPLGMIWGVIWFENKIWAGVMNHGLYFLENGKFVKHPESKRIKALQTIRQFCAFKDELIISTLGGIVKYKNGKFAPPSSIFSPTYPGCLGTSVNEAGEYVSVYSNAGIMIWKDDDFINYSESNGFKIGNPLSVAQDYQGGLWIGTSEGLTYLDTKSGKIKYFNHTNGLKTFFYYVVTIDKYDNLLVGSNIGIERIDLKKYYKQGLFESEFFNNENGFNGLECNTNCFYHQPDGKIIFGSVEGVYLYNPDFKPFKDVGPSIQIIEKNYQKDDAVFKLENIENHQLVLPYMHNQISFRYKAITHHKADQVTFQTFLEGWDKKWSDNTVSTDQNYASLPPGKYVFKVRAIGDNGISGNVAKFEFMVLTPWYYTWWGIILEIIGLILIMVLVLRARSKALIAKNKQLEFKVKARTQQLLQEKEKVDEQKLIIEEKNRKILASINYAKNIQRSTSLTVEEIEQILPGASLIYYPKEVVSGDFYWIREMEDKIVICLADCTGHGVPGGFMSMIGNILLNEIVAHNKIYAPDKITELMHQGIVAALKQEKINSPQDGMDVTICVFDKLSKTLEIGGARSGYFMIVNNEVLRKKTGPFPLGGVFYSNDSKIIHKFSKHVFQVEQKITLILTSDGFVDQTNNDSINFGSGRMKKMIMESMHLNGKNRTDYWKNELKQWRGEAPQQDDICVLAFEIE